MTTRAGSLAMVGALLLFGGCSSGSSDADGAASGKAGGTPGVPYTKRCARTFCDSCRDQVASSCSECTSLCSVPGAYSGCYSDCRDLCNRDCSSCSGEISCETWEVELPLPAQDVRLFDSCVNAEEMCRPYDYNRSYCNYIARTMRPELAETFECINSRGCDAVEECVASWSGGGTLGTRFCERSARCGTECAEHKEDFLNGIADTLRPELERSLQQCIAEPSCGEFEACALAHNDLWQLAWEKADPGTPSECSEAWLADCGTCSCGFSCVRGCSSCTARCVIPCNTDADCKGTSAGTTPTPHCSRYGDDPGYCTFVRD